MRKKVNFKLNHGLLYGLKKHSEYVLEMADIMADKDLNDVKNPNLFTKDERQRLSELVILIEITERL